MLYTHTFMFVEIWGGNAAWKGCAAKRYWYPVSMFWQAGTDRVGTWA